jgi:hypothetical protein
MVAFWTPILRSTRIVVESGAVSECVYSLHLSYIRYQLYFRLAVLPVADVYILLSHAVSISLSKYRYLMNSCHKAQGGVIDAERWKALGLG